VPAESLPSETMQPPFMIGRTHQGRVRANNEDAISFDTAAGIAVLADGMGGLNAGEVASHMAVDTVFTELLSRQPLAEAVSVANRRVFESARSNPAWRNMGTTLIAACIGDGELNFANVGDSRIYRYSGGVLEQLSRDHSVVQQLLDSGALSEEEAWHAPNRNIITRALGIEASVEVDLHTVPLSPVDLFLLCSDGLSDMLRLAELEALFTRYADAPADLVDALIDAANDAGGADNISVLLVGAP